MQKTSQNHSDDMNQVPQPIRGNEGGTDPGPRNVALDRQNPDILTPPSTDSGTIPNLKFSFGMARNRLQPGGWSREVTARELPIATTLAGVNMRLNPGGVRELHWHKEAEWAYMLTGRARITGIDPNGYNYIEGQGRMTVFASSGKSRTFDYQAGDVGYVPFAMGHYIENTGDTTLRYLEMFKSDHFADVSLNQWLALTPPELVQAHLNLTPAVMGALRKQKRPIV